MTVALTDLSLGDEVAGIVSFGIDSDEREVTNVDAVVRKTDEDRTVHRVHLPEEDRVEEYGGDDGDIRVFVGVVYIESPHGHEDNDTVEVNRVVADPDSGEWWTESLGDIDVIEGED